MRDWSMKNYEATCYVDLPSGSGSNRIFDFARPGNKVSLTSLQVRFTTSCSTWTGVFHGSYQFPKPFDVVLACPSADEACVISGGDAYWFNVDRPSEFSIVPCWPIAYGKELPDYDALLFADQTSILVMSASDEVVWEQKLVRDDFESINVVGENIIAIGHRPRSDIREEIRVRLSDGAILERTKLM